jgi:hypothetical protein
MAETHEGRDRFDDTWGWACERENRFYAPGTPQSIQLAQAKAQTALSFAKNHSIFLKLTNDTRHEYENAPLEREAISKVLLGTLQPKEPATPEKGAPFLGRIGGFFISLWAPKGASLRQGTPPSRGSLDD